MLRQEKVGSGKLEFIHHSWGTVLHGPGADAGSGPEIPPREGRTHTTVVLDHLLVRQAFDMYGLGQFLTLGRVPQPYFKTEETGSEKLEICPKSPSSQANLARVPTQPYWAPQPSLKPLVGVAIS